MSQRSDEFIEETIRFWQLRLKRELTQEDARQIVENMSGFFSLLSEWDVKVPKAREGPCMGGGAGSEPMIPHGELPTVPDSPKLVKAGNPGQRRKRRGSK